MNPFIIHTHTWLGSQELYLDTPTVTVCRQAVIGCYGGNRRAGADKNEDAALVWCADDGSWEFAMIVDAHYSSESAQLLIDAIISEQRAIVELLSRPVETALRSLPLKVSVALTSEDFRTRCQNVHGEASCIIAARKGRFLWWMSIGDCLIYLLHPELARLGQMALNQRSFFEWVGRANSLDLPVPCYTSGIRELREGWNSIVMTTDGLLEFGTRPFENPMEIYTTVYDQGIAGVSLSESIGATLERVHRDKGRDSATIIAWWCDNRSPALRATL